MKDFAKSGNEDWKECENVARQGNAEAQRNLGWMYERGLGVDLDFAQAAVWYGRAAEQGFEEAREALARLLPLLRAQGLVRKES